MKKFIKKNLPVIIIGALVILFVVLAVLLKDNNKETTTTEVENWLAATKEEESVVTVYAQTTCGHCKLYSPIMEEVYNEYDFNLYWFDVDSLNRSDYNLLTYTYNLTGYSGTPYTLITKAGEVVAYHSGRMEKETLVNFLAENGVIEKNE